MNKESKILILTILCYTCFFFGNINSKAMTEAQLKAIVEYDGANGAENDVLLNSGCPQDVEYFEIGGERFIFPNDVKAAAGELANYYCRNNTGQSLQDCLNAQTGAMIDKINTIVNDATGKGYYLQSDGSFMKELGTYPQGCYRSGNVGVRVSIVNENGTQKKGTKILDFWSSRNFLSGVSLKANNLRTIIVNGGKISFNVTPSIGGYIDKKMGDYTQARITLKNEVIESSAKQSINQSGYLKKLGIKKWGDLDEDDHIMFEPLFVITIKDKNYVGTGTEIFSLLVDHTEASYLRADFIKEITGKMVLTKLETDPKDDTDQTYTLNSNGKKYTVYQNIPQSSSELKNNKGLVLKEPNGYAMELIWLKPYLKKKDCCIPCVTDDENLEAYIENNPGVCDPNNCEGEEEIATSINPNGNLICEPKKDCCIPCVTDDENLLNYIYIENHTDVCDPNNCEGEEEIATGIDSNGNLVCEPNVPEECCDPTVEDCCEIGTKLCTGDVVDDDYYDTYCQPDSCKPLSVTPEAETKVCDTDGNSSNNVSYFRDGVFTSNGQFGNVSIESLNAEMLNKIVSEYDDNTFLATAYSDDDMYKVDTSSINSELAGNDICPYMYCQEITEIQLPNNIPSAESGRYFTWSISDSQNLVKEKNIKLCAVDIDLDKFIEEYYEIVEEERNNVAGIANMNAYDFQSADNVGEYPVGASTEIGGSVTIEQCVSNAVSACKSACSNVPSTTPIVDADCVSGCATRPIGNGPGSSGSCIMGCTSYGSTGGSQEKCESTCESQDSQNKYEKTCQNYIDDYKDIISKTDPTTNSVIPPKYAQQVSNLYKKLVACNNLGNDISMNSDLGLDVLVNTLIDEQYYSSSIGDIIKSDNALKSNFASMSDCFEKTHDCNKDNYFSTAYSREVQDGDNIVSLPSCSFSDKWSVDPKQTNLNPLLVPGYGNYGTLDYAISYSSTTGWDLGSLNIDPSYWNTIKLLLIPEEYEYKLKESINACVCIDGTVEDANEDGTCDCNVETYTEYEITNSEYGEYYCRVDWKSTTSYKIPEGNFNIEFMNPSGYYPLALDYYNIGFDGHFSTLFMNGDLEDKNNHCDSSDGTCHYSDGDGVCYFELKNKVLIDNGKIEDSICPEGECEEPIPPDDDCHVGDCRIPDDICAEGECKVGGMEIIYRQVDLDNPFPNRTPGKNWINEENTLTEVITNNRGVEGKKLYNSNLEPLYSVTMTPAIIKEIRKVNASLNYDYASEKTMIYGAANNNSDDTPSNNSSYIYGVSGVLRNQIQGIALNHNGDFTINLDGDDRFNVIADTADEGFDCSFDGVIE